MNTTGYEARSRAGEQSLAVAVGAASVTVTVDYGQTPPVISVSEEAGEYASGSALREADEIGPARWESAGWNGLSMNAEEGRDLAAANREAMEKASKRWRVFRRRHAEATAAWSEAVRRDEADALAERNREAHEEEKRRNAETRAAWVRAQEEAGT